ncbi:nuclear transport factor 2 family protein [Maricaulis sp.]|uniref:nuclear transport factor 2 family protein n=1 Tax=Maricaulis sp. TaxID=1486257 RepID=UPI001B2CC466|nr:limonene-1,2-epoxide hydrolase family protein [Maricaulis sp.]MBO6764300.1 nuclear transport factor 2 family protein [Maricaulis sp.]
MSRKTDILQSIIDVWCHDQDIDAVLAHVSDDLVWHYSAISQPPKHGKAGAREFLEAYKAKVRNPRWRIFKVAETEDALFVEGVDEFDTADGHHAVVPYMGILEFDGDLISGWRDYFDRGSADRSAAGTPLPDYTTALTARTAVLEPSRKTRN